MSPHLSLYSCSKFLLLIVLFPAIAHCDCIKIGKLEVDQVADNEWLRYRFVICGKSTINRMNGRYLDHVKTRFYLSYGEPQQGFEFYLANAELLSIKSGKRYVIDFFLPRIILDRKQFPREPFAYLIEFEVEDSSGRQVLISESSANLRKSNTAREFLKKNAVDTHAVCSGSLIPSYLMPFNVIAEWVEQYPFYRRGTDAS